MLKFNPSTPIRFYSLSTNYETGETWTDLGVLYCEWRGTHGERQISAQAMGVNDSATIRTFYHPTICTALKSVRVVIIKNNDTTAIVNGAPDVNNINTYELWAGVDNVGEQNQFMEFVAKRYENK